MNHRPVEPARRPEKSPEQHHPVSDGALVGLLLLLLGSVTLVWTATGLAALLGHGRWPAHLPFLRSAQAVRHLLTAPRDLAGAWAPDPPGQPAPGPLPSPAAFWSTAGLLLLLVLVLAVAVLTLRARIRGARAAGPGDAKQAAGVAGPPSPAQPPAPRSGAGDPRAAHDQLTLHDGAVPTRGPLTADTGPWGAGSAGPAPAAGAHPERMSTPAPRAHTGEPVRTGPSTAGPGTATPLPGPAAPTAHARPTGAPAGAAQPGVPAPHPLSFEAVRSRADGIRPHADGEPARPGARGGPDPLAHGFALGHDAHDGTPLIGAFDRTHCLFTPPPARGTAGPRLLHAAIAGAPGPVLATASCAAVWEATAELRARTGPVRVFDPARLTAADPAQRLRWAPHDRCEDPVVATGRADALLFALRPVHPPAVVPGTAPGGRPDPATVHDAARTVLGCWLHAAALDGRPFRQVHRWAHGRGTADAVRILRTVQGAAEGWSGRLEAVLTSPHPALREAACAVLRLALDALSELHVLNACTPSANERLDTESFLGDRGSLYVVGPAVEAVSPTRAAGGGYGAPGVMPLLTALVHDVVEHGRRMAARSSGGRLDPPLLAVLDDVAAVAPLPGLPDLMTHGGRLGIPAVIVLRSPEQARARWDGRSVHRLWTAAGSCGILGPAEPGTVRALLAGTSTAPADTDEITGTGPLGPGEALLRTPDSPTDTRAVPGGGVPARSTLTVVRLPPPPDRR